MDDHYTKSSRPYLFTTNTTVPSSVEAPFSREWIYWISIARACRNIRNYLTDVKLSDASLYEYIFSTFFEQCVHYCYGLNEYVFERHQEMPFAKTKHKNNESLCPAFVIGFPNSKLKERDHHSPSVGGLCLPFLIGVEALDDEARGKVELALQMQRALDYQEDFFGNSSGRLVIGALLTEYCNLSFFYMTKNSDSQYELHTVESYFLTRFSTAILAAQVICNVEKVADQFFNNEGIVFTTTNETHSDNHDDAIGLPPVPSNSQYEIDLSTVIYETHGTKIYKGKDIQTGKEVAIKRKNWYQYPKTPVEVEIAQLLEGKNHTCKLIDSYGGTDVDGLAKNNKAYTCVFEYIKPKRPDTKEELKQYMKHLLQALAHSHKNGVIHRDVKLDNIIFNEISGETTLIDFEAAILIGQAEYSYAGTQGYYPPELDEPGGLINFSFSGDIWSAGVVFLELMLGLDTPDEDDEERDILRVLESTITSFTNEPERFLKENSLFSKEGLDLAEEMLSKNR